MNINSKNDSLKLLKDTLKNDTDLLQDNLKEKNKIINYIQRAQSKLIQIENYCSNTKKNYH